MAIYAISDLHLGFSLEKPMDIFGEKWKEHHKKIEENWKAKINNEDTVLIAGDISWAINEKEALVDLEWIEALPGKKILSKGNHDYWWVSIKKLNKMFENTKFIQNNFFAYEDYAICGTRGWLCPGSDRYSTEPDERIYLRELIRLRLSLEEGKKEGFEKFIVMLHYPPTNEKLSYSEFQKLIEEYNVEKVIYGHLHGVQKEQVLEGIVNGCEYILTSADYIDFNPLLIK